MMVRSEPVHSQVPKAKPGRENTDDGVGCPIQDHLLPDDVGGGPQAVVPRLEADHRHRGRQDRAVALLIRHEPTAPKRLDAQDRKQGSAAQSKGNSFRRPIPRQSGFHGVVNGYALEGLGFLSPDPVLLQ